MVLRFLLLVLALAGCGRAEPPSSGIALVDDAGHRTVLPSPPTRIVSLVPAATELLFALGGGDRLVGRTKWCDYPAAAEAIPSVGDGMSPNVEAVAARKPDLVVVYQSAANAGAVSRFRALGIPVLEVALDLQDDFERDARLLARAIGRPEVGDSLATAVAADLERATVAPAERPSVLVLVWSDPPIAIGGGSFLSEIVTRAGGRNIFGDRPEASFKVSIEAVVDEDPDRVLVTGLGEPAFAVRPEWRVVPAVRERRFVRVTGSEFNRPSPRIGEAVRSLASALSAATGTR